MLFAIQVQNTGHIFLLLVSIVALGHKNKHKHVSHPRPRGGGGGQWYVCATPPLTQHFHFPPELYVYITLTNNYLAFFIYKLIILCTISINWHRRLLVNNHISKYNSFILVLYRTYINYVCHPPPPPTLFSTFERHCTHTHTHTQNHIKHIYSVNNRNNTIRNFNEYVKKKKKKNTQPQIEKQIRK